MSGSCDNTAAAAFAAQRSRITQRLLRDKGFMAVAVEADWPDAYRVNATCAATAAIPMRSARLAYPAGV